MKLQHKKKRKSELTSEMERHWTFFMLGTTKPCGVAIATPMLWDPSSQNNEQVLIKCFTVYPPKKKKKNIDINKSIL